MTEEIAPPPPGELPWVLEAILFVAEEPQAAGALAAATGVGEGAVRKALKQLAADYEARGLRVMDDGRRFQLATHPAYAAYVDRFLGMAPGARLSRAALEVLTIVAYRQPCTRSEIESVRGVNSDRIVTMLESRGLLEETGIGEARASHASSDHAQVPRTLRADKPRPAPPLPVEPQLFPVDPL